MKIAVRYASRGGNTKKLAEAIAEVAGVKAEPVTVPLSEDVDLLFLGTALYAGRVDEPVLEFFKDNTKKIGKLVSFSTTASPRTTFKHIAALAEQYGIPMYPTDFHSYGSFLVLHRDRPNAQDLNDARVFAKKVITHET